MPMYWHCSGGSGVSGRMVCTPPPAMLNVMLVKDWQAPSSVEITSRSDPGPLSLVLVTTVETPLALSVDDAPSALVTDSAVDKAPAAIVFVYVPATGARTFTLKLQLAPAGMVMPLTENDPLPEVAVTVP